MMKKAMVGGLAATDLEAIVSFEDKTGVRVVNPYCTPEVIREVNREPITHSVKLVELGPWQRREVLKAFAEGVWLPEALNELGLAPVPEETALVLFLRWQFGGRLPSERGGERFVFLSSPIAVGGDMRLFALEHRMGRKHLGTKRKPYDRPPLSPIREELELATVHTEHAYLDWGLEGYHFVATYAASAAGAAHAA